MVETELKGVQKTVEEQGSLFIVALKQVVETALEEGFDVEGVGLKETE